MIAEFWEKARAAAGPEAGLGLELPPAWAFGAGKEMADALASLVVAGRKTATSSLYAHYLAEGELIPEAGQLHIILDGNGKPVALIRIIAVELVAFRAITPEQAAAEGEGDLSLEYWRSAHQEFWGQVAEDALVVYERFGVVYAPGTA
ncbi:ASCH domain-containing protein [Corynebacterium kozikiae]|uniref:ASCH domain-containing protein n=1 Tax=Corynebacterium kozikiae TaxID=2968469 RepID=UPI00211BAC79|nr:ASCH domain-containing protein [Corynebacterium sp. 76QC2CO]MCQ9344083.1 ASCH domain-containing protein [Corynebacterium sp. 76QC2CO]